MTTVTALATVAALAPLTWTTAKGQEKTAHSAIAQAHAPKAARLSAAQAADLSALNNGQYRPFMQSVRASLTKGEVAALMDAPDFSLAPTGKAGMLAALGAISGEWDKSAAAAAAKGKKPSSIRAALHATLNAYLQGVAEADAIKRAGMAPTPAYDDSAFPAADTGAAPAADAAPAPAAAAAAAAALDTVAAAAAAGITIQ